MTTLEDAWAWYQATSDGAKRLAHLAKHWDSLPWDSQDRWVGLLQRDGVLRHIESEQLSSGAKTIQDGLDDLAVLVLFSVFEAIVRALVGEQVRVEAAQSDIPHSKKLAPTLFKRLLMEASSACWNLTSHKPMRR